MEGTTLLAQYLYWLAPLGSVLALFFAYLFYSDMSKSDPGSERSQEIASYVREGAMAYLWAQYKTVSIFFVFAFVFFAFLSFVLKVQSPWTPFAFLTGGFFSGLSGYLGMLTATKASNRTAAAAVKSLNQGLQVAFRSGAVMGFVVVGLGLLDISIWWKVLNWVMEAKETFKDSIFHVKDYLEITTIMLTFGMGASTQALFARVGGGIFTKAADVGADLVGKTEAGIPEDDPRNPAVIADNVGDNVGDVAGMGADLYESYCGSILATAALGASAFTTPELSKYQLASIILPMAIAGVGIIFSIIGVYTVRTHEEATQKDLMAALGKGINLAAFLNAIASGILVYILLPEHLSIYGSIISGLLAGIIIGWATEYYTSSDYEPTKEVASHATTGAATVLINGIANGMLSTGVPVVTVCVAILLAYGFAGGFETPAMGLYGIGIAAVGMLSTLGITLATDAYGPIADNAGGNAEMSHLGPEVRKRTDALDALGNTTAATGKGFAIGSAALTAMALLGAYVEEIRAGLIRLANATGEVVDKYIYTSSTTAIPIEKASLHDFMIYYDVNLMNPQVIVGFFIGAMIVFVFCALTMKAVGRAAHSMVMEVRRQFKEIPGLLKGEPGAKADYAACVAISTKGAQQEMILPSIIAVIVPIIVGLLLGPSGVMGLLMGGLACGFVVAIFMANAGGSWDNAKKYIEGGEYGGKGSDSHKAAVVGDTVGDPFKDTSGPSLNILIKLMSMVAVVVAGLTVAYAPTIQQMLGFNPTEYRLKEEARANIKAGTIKFLDPTNKQSKQLDDVLDDEDLLLGAEDSILPEDDEELLAEDVATESTEIQVNSKSKDTSNSQTESNFSAFEDTSNKISTSATESSQSPQSDFSGFESLDDQKQSTSVTTTSTSNTASETASVSISSTDSSANLSTQSTTVQPSQQATPESKSETTTNEQQNQPKSNQSSGFDDF